MNGAQITGQSEMANARKNRQQEKHRELIHEWYKLLKPFHARLRSGDDPLEALADDLAQNAIISIIWQFIFCGCVWTGILVLLYLFGGRELRQDVLWLGPLGYIGLIAAILGVMKQELRIRLRHYAEGYWIARHPVTGKEIYPLIECPECKKKNYSNRYLRYLEPCEYCGHNIDWEAVKIKH
jgi:hypothetical protein